MGFFRRLFRSGPDRGQWPGICLEIASGLEDSRRSWFSYCVQILKSHSKLEIEDKVEFEVSNDALEGKADMAIKAYQLYLVSGFIAQHRYISPSEGSDFADMLFAQVCGTQVQECLVYFDRYLEVKDGGRQLFRFTSDVAEHITGDDSPLIPGMAIAQTFPAFVNVTHQIVASCFYDDETLRELKSKLEQHLEGKNDNPV